MDHEELLKEINQFFNAYPVSSPVRGHAQYLLGRLEAAERTARASVELLRTIKELKDDRSFLIAELAKCEEKQKALGKLLSESFPTGR